MLKVGIAGFGKVSRMFHAPAWESFSETELVAVCDVRTDKIEKFEDKHRYTSYDEMLECEKLDIVDICVPTFLHKEFALKALEKGINVICEKPVSLVKEDVAKVYEAARRNHVQFMVGQALRFYPGYDFLRNIIRSQKYGKVISGNMLRLREFPGWSAGDWMKQEKKSGLVAYDLHIHDIDFLVSVLGKPTEIKSFRSKLKNQDVIQVMYNFNGVNVYCEAAWYAAQYPFTFNYRFQFERALVVFERDTVTVYMDNGDIISSDPAVSTTGEVIKTEYENGYTDAIRYFKDCIYHGKTIDMIKENEVSTVIQIINSL